MGLADAIRVPEGRLRVAHRFNGGDGGFRFYSPPWRGTWRPDRIVRHREAADIMQTRFFQTNPNSPETPAPVAVTAEAPVRATVTNGATASRGRPPPVVDAYSVQVFQFRLQSTALLG